LPFTLTVVVGIELLETIKAEALTASEAGRPNASVDQRQRVAGTA
jgi:hypothetical protein